MKKIKISTLWTGDLKGSLIIKLIEHISKKEIKFVSPEVSDILIFGPYDTLVLKRKFSNLLIRKAIS